MNRSIINISPEVQDAITEGRGVVALESTIITHGMPYPHNIDTARKVEQTVRATGAIPATIAVLSGQIAVGLNEAQLEELATSSQVMKLSRADIAMAVSKGVMGSTTVAATMIVAKLAGISVVICAGAKAILDLPKTLEVLETNGVPVLAYGQDNLPAFWSRDSGLKAPLRADSVDEIVQFLKARKALNIEGGILIANPVPIDNEIPGGEMKGMIQQAISESQQTGIQGKAVTPWLLNRIFELSDGRSLTTNQALIINNASLAGSLATHLAQK